MTHVAPKRLNLKGLAQSMAPNITHALGLGDIHGIVHLEGCRDIHGTKAYKFIGFGNIHSTKAYTFIRFGDIHDTKAYKFHKVW